jgi:hypothetical protein
MVIGVAYTGVWWGKTELKKLLVIPRHRWKNNIQTDFQEALCGGTDWIELAQDRGR